MFVWLCSGPVPLEWFQKGGFPRLLAMSLGQNTLTGSLPEWARDGLASLQMLDLSANNLTGSLPKSWLSDHPSLRYDGEIYLEANILESPFATALPNSL